MRKERLTIQQYLPTHQRVLFRLSDDVQPGTQSELLAIAVNKASLREVLSTD